MERTEDLEQQIWDFTYGLLPEDEAERLTRRITSEPDTARLYAEVKLQADLLAEAAQLDVPPISLVKPAETETKPPAQFPDSIPAPVRRLPAAVLAANWFVGLAAALLVCVMGYSYLRPDSAINEVAVQTQKQNIIDGHVHTILYGPPTLQPAPTSRFIVATRSAYGKPRSVPLKYKFYDKNEKLLHEGDAETNLGGLAQIETPGELETGFVHVKVATNLGVPMPAVEKSLPVGEVELTTHLTLDKPLYRPGEVMRYRSLTLSRFGLRVRREATVKFRVLDSSGSVVLESQGDVVTEHGVGQGKFAVPADQPGGKYTLVARSPAGDFPDARHDFYIREYRTPTLKQHLAFARDSFGPGDEVVADFKVERAEGEAMPNAPLRIVAKVDGKMKLNLHTAADEYGAYKVRFPLPKEMQKGQGLLSVTVANETIARPIPVIQGDVSIEFFPESGELVAGIKNCVYFHARDSVDKPVHVEGRILDNRDEEVAVVKTDHEGRGRFNLTPLRDETYRLEIDTPSGAVDGHTLPKTSDLQFVTLNTGIGVFDAGRPIVARIRSTQCYKTLAVTAVCRGVVAGQQVVSGDQFVSREAGIGLCDVTVPLAENADGVIRLTAYDLSVRPPQPVAERLVYRRPARRLDIRVAGQDEKHAPGDQVELGLLVHDENGQPQQAVLGVSVVDDALLALADDKSPRMTTHFWLTSQIDKPEELEDANFYLKEDEQATAALDLLLATQGWRKFKRVPLDRLARADIADKREGKPASQSALASLATGEAASPVILADNNRQSRKALEGSVQKFHNDRQFGVRRIGQIVFSGGLAVLIALAIMGLLRLTAGVKVWVPAVAAATACLIVGSLWMDLEIDVLAEVATLPQNLESEEVENVAVVKRGESEPAAPIEKTEKLAETQEEIVEPLEVEEEEAPAMPEEPESYGRGKAEEDAGAVKLAVQDMHNKVPASAAAPAPSQPAVAARSAAADQPAPDAEAGEKVGARGGGMGGMGGGGFAREKSKELADAEAKKKDAVKSELERRRMSAARAPSERKMLGKADAIQMDVDDEAEALDLAPEGVAVAGEAKDEDSRSTRGAKRADAAPADDRASGRGLRNESDPKPGGEQLFLARERYFAKQQLAGGILPTYDDTLLWQPLLLTDANGRASVRFTLPGVITSYRVLVDGHMDGRIGSGEGKIVSHIPPD
ncbi:MAG: hypothetical protein H8E44_09195 [Planctomycetes bacterium]|nr:hypothetical protein [Planctomycetota bacterium]MBL7044582.1 hypothetical protein [Pirellulaceae bacterium]